MPTANAHCERLIGSIRREGLDYVILLHVLHLRRILREWVRHYNTGRRPRPLGPGYSEQMHRPADSHKRADEPCRASRVIAKPILGGLHHEYRWEKRCCMSSTYCGAQAKFNSRTSLESGRLMV